MASAFTHAFAVLPLAALASGTLGRTRLLVLLVAVSILPDLDVLAFAVGIPYDHPLGHRGATHSIVFAMAVGACAVLALGRKPTRDRAGRLRLFAAVTLACASHGVLDAMTDAGLGVGFALPFSEQRFFFPWRPIATSPIDPTAFFSRRGLEILASEFAAVWIPVTIAWVGVTLSRRGVLRKAPEPVQAQEESDP